MLSGNESTGGRALLCSYIYFTIPPHSIWIPYGMSIFHGFHMEYVSPYKSNSYYYGFHMESMSIPYGMSPHGIHMESVYFTIPPHSIWIPYGMSIFHGFHMEYVSSYKSNSYYYGSTWNPYGIHIDSTQIPHGIHVEHTYTS